MIDIVAAMESVVEAAIAVDARPRHRAGVDAAGVAAVALALAVPAARRPGAGTDALTLVRTDPARAARVLDCTVGAILVWRAVDRSERAGQPGLAAAEAGLHAALGYVELVSAEQFASLGVDEPRRRAELAILEVQARLALSRAVEETA